ncbi:MAG: nucleoside deaminase [Mycoplasmataceae bacterium]|nr:nucleoside deaminase [Mycoplasmataceae bacterium]
MQAAIKLAYKGMKANAGGPFGAVIVCQGKIVGQGYNQVLKTNDPTKHAEMVAISDAAKNLGRFDMSDCEIYATGQPCPMCLAAIAWARIKTCYYGNDYNATSKIGFDDQPIMNLLQNKPSKIKVKLLHIDPEESKELYDEFVKKNDKTIY